MTSTAGSPTPSRKRVTRAAVVTHGTPGQIGSGLARLQAVAQEHGVELVFSNEESTKHGVAASAEAASADLAVILGGDGTVLRALTRFLGTGVPVIGVNFGRVGFLSSMGRRELEVRAREGLRRRIRRRRAPDARAGAPGRPNRGGERCRRLECVARAHDRARAGRRRGGAGPSAVRRDHLLDAVRARRRTTSRTAGPC